MLDDFLSMKLTDVEKAAVRENVFFKRVHRELQELEVTGGKALLKTRKGKVILQEKKTGRGRVIISGVSSSSILTVLGCAGKPDPQHYTEGF